MMKGLIREGLEFIPERLLAKVLQIPGWMSEVECDFLYGWVQQSDPDAVIVELGTWRGKSTAAEYLAMHDEQTVVTVDTWLGQADLRQETHIDALKGDLFLEFMSWMHRMGIYPMWYERGLFGPMYLRATTVDAATMFADASIDKLFVDADHRAVGEDLDAWLPKLRPDGEIAGHDLNWVGVREQIEARLQITRSVADIWVAEKLP